MNGLDYEKFLFLLQYLMEKVVHEGLLRVGEMGDVRLHVWVDDGRAGHSLQGDPHFDLICCFERAWVSGS